MKTKIDQLKKLAADLRELTPQSPFLGNAISACNAAADNLLWHLAAEEKAKVGKSESGKVGQGSQHPSNPQLTTN